MNLFWELVGGLAERLLSTAGFVWTLASTVVVLALLRFASDPAAFSHPKLAALAPKLSRAAKVAYRAGVMAVATAVVIALLSIPVIEYGRYAGLLRFKTVQYQVKADRGISFTDTHVAAFLKGSNIADATVDVDPFGYFAVPNCYRAPYEFLVFKINAEQTELTFTRFERDLRASENGPPDPDFPREKRKVEPLGTFHFDTSRFDLDEQGDKQAVQLLEKISNMKIQPESLFVLGHADDRGSEAENFELGTKRAMAVSDALRAGTLATTGRKHQMASFGERWPAAIGSGAKVWGENRRVVVYGVMPEVTDVAARSLK